MATESFFSNASLAYLASAGAGKDGKTYSIKPTDGSGDFTFSRGSNLSATRVGPTGLIEKGRENLLLQSNAFSTSPWTDVTASVTSGQTGYDGSNDAWLLEKSGSSGRILQSISAVSGVYTYSVYAKEGASNSILLLLDASADAYAYFNLSAGTLLSNSNIIDGYITDAGNGWYRVSVLVNITSFDRVRIYPAQGADTSATTGSIYIQDAQVEIGLAATDYIESGATTGKAGLLEDEPRFDYSGGATCPSLLLEPSRTNSLGQSEYFDGYYTKFASGITYDTNTSETTSPEGLYNATKLISSTNNEQQAIYKNVAVATPTLTCYAKAGEFDTFALKLSGSVFCNFTLTGNGSTGYSANISDKSIEPVGNGWYRCSISATSDSIYAWIAIAGGGIQGDGTSGIYIYGAQLEAGRYPTSYIPNHSGGSVTRGADACNGAGDASTFNSTEGVLYAEISAIDNELTYKEVSLSDGTSSNRIEIRYLQNKIEFTARISGVSEVYANFTPSSVFDFNKIALRYNGTDFKLYLNGSLVATDTSVNTFSANTLNSAQFNSGAGASVFYGNAKQVLVFNEALSDADCITLTT